MINKKRKLTNDDKAVDKDSSEMENSEKSNEEESRECIIVLNLLTSFIPLYENSQEEEKDKCICLPFSAEKEKVIEEREIIPDIVLQTKRNEVQLVSAITKLKTMGYPLSSSIIYYYSREAEEYVYCGSDPIDPSIYLSFNDENNLLNLKCHCFLDVGFVRTIDPDREIEPIIDVDAGAKEGKSTKRTKERKIGSVIEKVNAWRRLYNGYYDENRKFVKHSLEDAARILNTSKKSLDDYLLQLRLGRKYGFNFNENKSKRVGILRTFVKEKRQEFNNCQSADTHSLM